MASRDKQSLLSTKHALEKQLIEVNTLLQVKSYRKDVGLQTDSVDQDSFEDEIAQHEGMAYYRSTTSLGETGASGKSLREEIEEVTDSSFLSDNFDEQPTVADKCTQVQVSVMDVASQVSPCDKEQTELADYFKKKMAENEAAYKSATLRARLGSGIRNHAVYFRPEFCYGFMVPVILIIGYNFIKRG